jgi:hypothetical protein
LAANANSQEPMGEEIWQGSVVLVARMGRVALTDQGGAETGERALYRHKCTKHTISPLMILPLQALQQ